MSATREGAERVLRDIGIEPTDAALDVATKVIESAVRAGIVKAMREYVSDLSHHHAQCSLWQAVGLRSSEKCDCDLAELLS